MDRSSRVSASGVHAVRAVTLVEIMVVVAIVGIMLGLALPNLDPLVRSMRVGSTARAMAAMVRTARSTALANHARVRVTATSGTVSLQSCRARFGEPNVCASGTSFTALPSGSLPLDAGDQKSVQLFSGPPTVLIFGPDGVPEIVAPDTAIVERVYTFATGSVPPRVVRVSAAGDVRIE